MKKIRKAILLTLVAPLMASFVSCDDVFEPAVENHKDEAALEILPDWAVGILTHAYISNPLTSWSFNDVATDDAVSNDPSNQYLRMATGGWTASNNPMSNWQNLRGSIQYLNQTIELADKVEWAYNPIVREMFAMRFKGEAYGMRALYNYLLLLHQAGWVGNELLGVPIVTEYENADSEFNKPRNTFAECIQQIYDDVDSAIELLPEDYKAVTNGNVPSKYASLGADHAQYNRVFDEAASNRMSGRIAKAIRAKAAFLAASPAYSAGSGISWEEAANQMASVLKGLGSNPVAEVDPIGHIWYADSKAIQEFITGVNPKEILWRDNRQDPSVTLEKDNFPPTLYGSGRINPTQNLVDAFPMANGLPISASGSGYNAQDPYKDRDPRLALYILYNGQTAGIQNTPIYTSTDGGDEGAGTDDAIGRTEKSTRTGYYMRKLLVQETEPQTNVTSNHYKPMIRYTEIFLSYAEAANEAWGPKNGGNNGFSAYDVIKAIRERAGICVGTTDTYLEACANDKEMMRELIRNERRLELCFEGHRFWDLRRWKASLTEPARGMSITGTTYTEIPSVEVRDYKDYMYYGPLPYSEVVKFSELLQNDGWK